MNATEHIMGEFRIPLVFLEGQGIKYGEAKRFTTREKEADLFRILYPALYSCEFCLRKSLKNIEKISIRTFVGDSIVYHHGFICLECKPKYEEYLHAPDIKETDIY